MTQIIIKKRRTLSLSKAVEKEEPPKISREEQEALDAQIRQQRYLDCREWISTRWPSMFNKKKIKPFAIGIHKEIIAAHKEAGGFEVLGFGSTRPVKLFISAWVRRKAYQKALSQPGAQRFNLAGEAIEDVSPEDQKAALEKLHAIKQSNKKRRKNNALKPNSESALIHHELSTESGDK